MSKHFKDNLEQAQKEIEKQDRLAGWVRDNLKPGMKVRFSGSRSNKGKDFWREVLEVRPVDRFDRVGYHNPDYVEFECDIGFSSSGPNYQRWMDEYNRQKEAFRKIHPDDRYALYVDRKVPVIYVTSKNVSARPRPHESTIVADNLADTLMEVEIDGVWVKARDLK